MKKYIIIVLVLLGIYFVFDHKDPFPLNHEAIGLGVNHTAHSIFGLVLFIAAGGIWWTERTAIPV